MALVINGDTIPYSGTLSFNGQPVHKVDVCYNPDLSPKTVWMDTEPQGRIRLIWNSVVFPAESKTYDNVANNKECMFHGMSLKYCGDCAFTCWQRNYYWTQCITGCMCIDCVAGIADSYSVQAYPINNVCFEGDTVLMNYSCDKTVNLTWTTGDGCSYTMETVGSGGDYRYYPRIHTGGGYGAWSDTFNVGAPLTYVTSNTSYNVPFTSCLCTDLLANATSGYGTRPVELQKTGRTYPLSMTLCRGPIDLSSCFEYYYISINGNKVSNENGNAICFTRTQLSSSICVNFATAKLIN